MLQGAHIKLVTPFFLYRGINLIRMSNQLPAVNYYVILVVRSQD